jgi:hypothetical protein
MPNNPNQPDRDRHDSDRHGGWQEKPGQQQGQSPGKPGQQQHQKQQQAQNPGKSGQQSGMGGGSAKPGQR